MMVLGRSVSIRMFILLLACSSPFVGRLKAGEERHAKGNFEIEFPGRKPSSAQSDKLEVGLETLEIHTFSTRSQQGPAFTVTYVDYPAHIVQERKPAELVTIVRQSTVSGLSGTVTAIASLKKHGGFGQQISFHGRTRETKTVGRLQVFLVENRLYQLLVWGPRDSFDKRAAQKFFKSFSLLRD